MSPRMWETVWARFVAREQTLGPTPGVREAWRRGRARYAVWLLRVHHPAVLARMAAIAADLGDWIEPVAEAHITVRVCGFPTADPRLDDDVSEATLRAHRQALLRADLPPVSVQIRGASSFASAAFVEVVEVRGLTALRAALSVPGCTPHRSSGLYQPHVTVGTYRATLPSRPIVEALKRHRSAPQVAIAPAAVELVTLDAAVPGAPLCTRWSIPLRSEGG